MSGPRGSDWDELPYISGQGSVHDLNDNTPEPRLWFAKSVSKQAAYALERRPPATIHPIGFHRPAKAKAKATRLKLPGQ